MTLDNPLISGEFEPPKPTRQDDRDAWRADWDARVKKHWDHGLRPTHKIVPQSKDLKRTTVWATHNYHFHLRNTISGWIITPTSLTTPEERAFEFVGALAWFPSIMDALDYLVKELEKR